jgi:hypothetical protein
MSGGNWGFEYVDHIRSRRSWRTRIALTIASILAAVVLVVLVLDLGRGIVGEFADELIILVGLLVGGILLGLRPWARR